MKTIRLGNDIVVRWSILRNGIADDLSAIGKPITVIVSGLGEEKRIENYAIEGNVISFKLYGRDLQTPGIYRLTYIENEGLPEMYSVDCNRAFRISGAGQATGGDDTVNITTETIELSSEITAPADGLSAYEVAVANGYVGSVEDWLQSLRGEKMTYADLTDSDKQDLYAGGASLITPLIDTKQDVIEDLDLIRNGAYKGDTALQPISLITYSNLVSLRDSNRLIPGMQYRITDYDFTTTEDDTDSAHMPFDIIVTADSESVLNESARAIHHQYAEGEEDPLASRDIAAWKLKYTLKNIKHSSSDGKGTILWMKDESRNECYYDFINALFRVYKISACPKSPTLVGTYAIKSNNSDITYETNSKLVPTFGIGNHDNIIRYYGLAKIVLGQGCYSNTFGNYCHSNTLGGNCHSNTFGNTCYYNVFGNDCQYNTFRSICYSNTLGNTCSHNTLWNNCHSNTLGKYCFSNIFWHSCSSNTLGDSSNGNTLGRGCEHIKTPLSSCSFERNFFGDGCRYIEVRNTSSLWSNVKNYNFSRGLEGEKSSYIVIEGEKDRNYETYVSRGSDGSVKIYCLADIVTSEPGFSIGSGESYPYSASFIGEI